MSRRYGPIGTSVWDSRKFLSLANDSNRLGYLYLIACPHGNALGVFRLPSVYFAADRRTDAETAEEMLADIERVGLIERGRDDQIRITKWFYNDTGANNPSTGSSFAKVFKDERLIKPGPLRSRAFVEMFMATLTKAEAWNPTTSPFGKMCKDLQSSMITEIRAHKADTLAALRSYPQPDANTVLHTVLDTVSHTVGGHGVPHMWHIETRETDTDTDNGDVTRTTETDTDTETDNGHLGEAHFGASNALADLPSLPPKGRQEDRPVDEDTAKIIAELTQKARLG